MVPADEQGELQGAIASINNLMSVASPVMMTRLDLEEMADRVG